jgi:uncharacterized protein YjiS (DUF1127 family)
MHTADQAPVPHITSLLNRLFRWIAGADATHAAHHRAHHLNDDSLKDIGLTAPQADAAFRRRFAEHRYHPRRYL